MRAVSRIVPSGHRPEHESCEKRRHRIDLGLNRREPEGIAEAEYQGSDSTGSQHGNYSFHRTAARLSQPEKPSCQPYCSQIENENRKRRTQCAHCIDSHGSVRAVCKDSEEAGDQLKDRIPRRMTDLQFIGRCYEFSAVPERGCGLHRKEVGNRSDKKNGEAGKPMP